MRRVRAPVCALILAALSACSSRIALRDTRFGPVPAPGLARVEALMAEDPRAKVRALLEAAAPSEQDRGYAIAAAALIVTTEDDLAAASEAERAILEEAARASSPQARRLGHHARMRAEVLGIMPDALFALRELALLRRREEALAAVRERLARGEQPRQTRWAFFEVLEALPGPGSFAVAAALCDAGMIRRASVRRGLGKLIRRAGPDELEAAPDMAVAGGLEAGGDPAAVAIWRALFARSSGLERARILALERLAEAPSAMLAGEAELEDALLAALGEGRDREGEDGAEALRRAAYAALGARARARGDLSEQAVAAIASGLDDEDGPALAAAMVAAGRTGRPELVAALIEASGSWLSQRRRLAAVLGLAALPPSFEDPEADAALADRADDWNGAVRAAARRALLTRPRTPKRRDLALAVLGDDGEEVDEATAMAAVAVLSSENDAGALKAITGRFRRRPPERPEHRRRLLELYTKRGAAEEYPFVLSWGEAGALEEALFESGSAERRRRGLLLGVVSARRSVRRACLGKALALPAARSGIRASEKRELALSVLERGKDAFNVDLALVALRGEAGDSRVREALVAALRDRPEPSLRSLALQSLGGQRDRALGEALALALEDRSPSVRGAGAAMLGQSGGLEGLEPLARLAERGGDDRRAAAAAGLAIGLPIIEAADARAVAALRSRLFAWARADQSDRALFALEVLGGLKETEESLPPFEKASLPRLRALLLPEAP